MKITAEKKERYSRMLALHDFGEEDMDSVMRTTVSVVGAGGLGSPALRLLTAIGFGRIRIIDRDVVELSNIQRQTVYNTIDIDKPKAEAAAANLALMNPNVDFEPLCVSLDDSNAQELLKGSDIIIDGLDSFRTRHSVNRASLALNIPNVFAGAIEYHSNLTTFIPNETGCLYCLAGEAKDDPELTCATVGVTPDLLSIAAAVEVREAILLAIGREPLLKGRIMTIDVSSLTFDFFDVDRAEACPVCSSSPTVTARKSEGPSVTILCSGAFCIAPPKVMAIDISTLADKLTKSYSVKRTDQSLIVETTGGAKVTIMTRGMAIVKGVNTQEEALSLYNEVIER